MQNTAHCCGRLPPRLGLIWLCAFFSPDTSVSPLWFDSHYQCPAHVSLPLTVLVAHWPQQETKSTNLMLSQTRLSTGICGTLCLILHWDLTVRTMHSSYSKCRQDDFHYHPQHQSRENWNLHEMLVRTYTYERDIKAKGILRRMHLENSDNA